MSESQDSPCNLIAPQAVKAGAPSGEIQRLYQLMETEDNWNGDFFHYTATNSQFWPRLNDFASDYGSKLAVRQIKMIMLELER
jgi:hypothetical protein